jgi:cyclic-di-GMP phosphodiesterase TipF (flagellum assembly factor)
LARDILLRGTSLDRLTLLATHALSAALVGFALTQYTDIDVAMAALSGVVAFLCIRYVHDRLELARDKREMIEDLNTIHGATLSLRGAHDDTKKKVIDITTTIARRVEGHEKKVASELKFLERLLTDFPTQPASETAAETKIKIVPGAAPAQARTLGDPAMLELVRNSLEENRVDLYLQPVVTLPQRKVRFYEALTRLRSADGSIVMPSQFINVAAPAGLMSVVDNLMLFRCIQLVRRLTQKTRDIAVFCNISEHTLADAEFFPQFLEYLRNNRDLAGHIVFEFAQDTVMQAGRASEAGLKALHEIGFRLSLDQVTALDCNFSRLRAQGFHFVKVKARTLTQSYKQQFEQDESKIRLRDEKRNDRKGNIVN